MKKKKNLNQKQKVLIISVIGGVLLIVVVAVLVVSLMKKPSFDPSVSDNKIYQDVEPEEAMGMYSELTEACTGALVWNIGVGDVVSIDDLSNTNACQSENYYSRMIGYTYDADSNVIMHVNVLKKVDDKLYRMDDTLVGDFNSDTIDESLNYGTTYEYLFQRTETDYVLSQVKLMDPIPEEVVEGE